MNRPTTAPTLGAATDTIELYLGRESDTGPKLWLARHTGPHAGKIRELFDTDTIPTPYSAATPGSYVLRQIQDRNPEKSVRLALEPLPEASA
jgi:hypothetical protein